MEKDFKFEEELKLPSLKMNNISMVKVVLTIILLCVFLIMWFLYSELYAAEAQSIDEVNFTVEKGESIDQMAERLGEEQIIRNVWLFKKYLIIKGIDKKVQAGNFKVIYPITLSRVANALRIATGQNEKTITIIPGWDLRDIAGYLKKIEIIKNEKELFDILGRAAVLYKGENTAPKLNYDFKMLDYKPNNVSFEGYLAPDTYRVFNNAALKDVIEKLLSQQNGLLTEKMYEDIEESGWTVHEILTMASILEREVKTAEEKAIVADILWRRYGRNWALQADSTVHYALGKSGNLFTTVKERNSTNAWNTYQYPGLPPGPISNPGLDSIMAAIYPQENDYWYFLTTLDGEAKYAKDLDEHNRNVQKYLR